MSRRSRAPRKPSILDRSIRAAQPNFSRPSSANAFIAENLEMRLLFSAAFDITQLTNMRADPRFSNITGKGIGIAVLDTGVFAQNPDLANLAGFYDAVESPVNTPVDPNFLQDAFDHEGHGSHTSGIAASSNPAIGVAYQATLVDVRVFSDPGENALPGDPIDRGLQWVALHAAQYNIKVVNMSLGEQGVNINFTPGLDQEGQDIQVLEQMGITVVSSSGNSYANDPVPGASIPAVESTISVGNTFSDSGIGTYDFSDYFGGQGDQWFAKQGTGGADVFNSTSQRSTLFNQVVAPGTDILSTWNSPVQLHNTLSGTSMSAPFVSGLVALMQQEAFTAAGTYLTPNQVLEIMKFASDPITDPVTTTNVRAEIQPSGTLGPPQPLNGTGDTFDRVNVYHSVINTQAFVHGITGIQGDLNNMISDATPLNALTGVNSDTAVGNIGFDGTNFIGNNDVDVYSVTLKAGGNLIISLSPTATGTVFAPTLRLFNSAGTQLFTSTGAAGNYPTIGTPAGQPLPLGTYYIGVSSAGNAAYNITNATGIVPGSSQGDYQLSATLTNPDPHGIPAAADTLSLSSPNTLLPNPSLGNVPTVHITGNIGQETAPDGTTVLVPNGDVHFYTVIAPDTGNLLIQANADVRVFDSNNNPIGTEGSNLVVPVQIGQVYFIGVTTQANAGFDPTNPFARAPGSTTPPAPFDLFVAFSNGDKNGTAAQASPAAIGTPITQAIGNDNGTALLGANGGNKDVDFYAFVAPAAGVIDLTATGASGFVPEMSLWSAPAGITGVTRLADANVTNSELFEQVTAGQTVLVAVTGMNNQNFNGVTDGSGAGGQLGTYTLNSSLQPLSLLKTLSNNSIQNGTPTPLALSQPLPANIGVDGSLVIGPNDVDIYSFTAPDTREYRLATDTSQDGDAQTVLRVFDTSGNLIAANQSGSAASTNSVVTVPMMAGQTYYVGVSGVGPSAFTYNPVDGTATAPGSIGNYTIMATDAGPFQRTVTFQQGQKPTTYTDSAGHKITVTLTGPGLGQLLFFSTTDGTDVGQFILNGSDNTSSVTIRGAANLPSVVVNGSLKSFTALTSNLTGNMTVTGGLNTLRLHTASSGTINIGSGASLTALVTSLTDVSLLSAEPIASIRASQWTITAAIRQQIYAPSIGSLVVPGAFDEDITVDTIRQMTVGSLVSSAIRANLSIAAISAGSATDSEIFAGVQPSLTTLPATVADFNGMGSLKLVLVRGTFSNTQVAAWTIGTVTLNNIQTANNGTPFGIAGNTIQRLRGVPAGAKPLTFKALASPLASISLGGDAIVRLIG